MDADLNFYVDPVCPFAWMTSKRVRQVQLSDYTVDWRFISLRLINAEVDYDAHFPPEYEAGHTAGLRLLRVAARARAEHGREAMAPLYAAFGAHIFDTAPHPDDESTEVGKRPGTQEFAEPILAQAGLPLELAQAVDDESWDEEIGRETDEALALTGKDVGTPIIHFEPPAGVAFFGPVISRLPTEESAAELWDHVVGLARFPGFAELKRSLREQPQLSALGGDPEAAGKQEDWHGGSRRQKK